MDCFQREQRPTNTIEVCKITRNNEVDFDFGQPTRRQNIAICLPRNPLDQFVHVGRHLLGSPIYVPGERSIVLPDLSFGSFSCPEHPRDGAGLLDDLAQRSVEPILGAGAVGDVGDAADHVADQAGLALRGGAVGVW